MQVTANPRVLVDVILPDFRQESLIRRIAIDAAIIFGFALLEAF